MSDKPVTREELDQRFNQLDSKLNDLIKIFNISNNSMGPPSLTGKRSNSSSSNRSGTNKSPRKKYKIVEDEKSELEGSLNSVKPSSATTAERERIVAVNDWSRITTEFTHTKENFDKMFELANDIPEELTGEVFDTLKENMMHREDASTLNEATRKSIICALLTKICACVSRKFDLKPNEVPKITEENSFVWMYGQDEVKGRYDVEVFKHFEQNRDTHFIVEMKARDQKGLLIEGRDQCLVYLKRVLEMGIDSEAFGIVCDLFHWKLISLTRAGPKVSAIYDLFEKERKWSDPLLKEKWLENYSLFVKVLYSIMSKKISASKSTAQNVQEKE